MSDRVPETIGELGVILVRVEKRLDDMVTKSSFVAEQERTREEFTDVRRDLADWKSESRGAHGELDQKITAARDALTIKIDAQRERAEKLEEDARKTRSSRTFTAVLTAAGWLVGIAGIFIGVALRG